MSAPFLPIRMPGRAVLHRHAALLVRPLDHNLRNTGLPPLLENERADPEVFVKELAVLALVGIPAAVPGPVDPEPKPDRVNFLPH